VRASPLQKLPLPSYELETAGNAPIGLSVTSLLRSTPSSTLSEQAEMSLKRVPSPLMSSHS
jgi:hypothetical protein